MSIEKFSGKFSSEAKGVTVLVNSVVQSIKDFNVLGLYVYLASMPDTWKPNAKELMKHTSFSKNKIYRLISALIAEGLMTVKEIREKGRFSSYHYTVHLHRQSCPQNEESANLPYSSVSEPCPQKPDADLPDTVFWDTYKTNTNIQNKEVNKTTTTSGNPAQNPSNRVVVVSPKITETLLLAFRATPFETDKIKSEDDFLSACEYSIAHRNDDKSKKEVGELGRVRGIKKLVKLGEFHDPDGWRKEPKPNQDFYQAPENKPKTESEIKEGKSKLDELRSFL